jgi:CheY-like chemotaxis protein
MPARLLLADDSITIQRVIELTFADEDIEVVAVGDGDAAIAQLEANPPDVVLADIGMPRRNGYEVVEHMRRSPALSRIPVLLLTGASEPADDARVRALGCAGVLVKPFDPQMAIARVRALLERRPDAAASSPSGAAVPSPLPDATPPTSPPGAERPARDVDAYFDELDAAFARLASAPEVPRRSAETPAAPRDAAPAPPAQPSSTLTMAGAFEALLGAEQGEPLPPALVQAARERQLNDEMAARIAVEVADRIVREVAPRIVFEVAERLVREEIERIRAAAEAP